MGFVCPVVYMYMYLRRWSPRKYMWIYEVHTCTCTLWQTMVHVQPEVCLPLLTSCTKISVGPDYEPHCTGPAGTCISCLPIWQNKLVNPQTIVSHCFECLLALMRHPLAATTKHYLSQLCIVQQYTDTPVSLNVLLSEQCFAINFVLLNDSACNHGASAANTLSRDWVVFFFFVFCMMVWVFQNYVTRVCTLMLHRHL